MIALLLAVFLNREDIWGRSFFRSAYYIPSIMPIVAVSILWIWLLQPRYGLINSFLNPLSIRGPNLAGRSGLGEDRLGAHEPDGIGTSFVISLAAPQAALRHLYDSGGKLDGANAVQKFFNVTVPMISPSAFSSCS